MTVLNGKFALVTGGSTGIGLASAIALAKEGARVAIVARNSGDLEKAASQIPNQPLVIQGDVSKLDDLDRIYSEVKKEFGSLDILFANAGIARFLPVDQVTEEHFDELVNINLKGAFFTVQKALPLLNEGSSVMLTTSAVGSKGFLEPPFTL